MSALSERTAPAQTKARRWGDARARLGLYETGALQGTGAPCRAHGEGPECPEVRSFAPAHEPPRQRTHPACGQAARPTGRSGRCPGPVSFIEPGVASGRLRAALTPRSPTRINSDQIIVILSEPSGKRDTPAASPPVAKADLLCSANRAVKLRPSERVDPHASRPEH